MHGSGRSQGWLIHLLAGAALGAVVVLLIWIFTGGRPFGEVVGAGDVSAPTTPAVATPAPATANAPTLQSAPPALTATRRRSGALRFRKPGAKRPAKKAERVAKAAKPRRTAKREGVVRVVAPPAEQPVAVTPPPAPTAAPPAPAAAPPAGDGGGGGAPAKRKSPGPTLWAGEG